MCEGLWRFVLNVCLWVRRVFYRSWLLLFGRNEPLEKQEFVCSYDSTWDSDEEQQEVQEEDQRGLNGRLSGRSYGSFEVNRFDGFCKAAKEMQNYRRGVPISDRSTLCSSSSTSKNLPNLNFYLGNQPSRPNGLYIQEFLAGWKGMYDKLENSHTFIQWLFPLKEQGMNQEASPLTEEEVEMFCQSCEARKNLLESYKMMLDFYGIKLINDQTGDVTRAENWKERFDNLNRQTHNNLRITRIIKCLGILGFQQFQFPLVQFFLKEILVKGELPSVKDSALDYFLFAVLNRKERRRLLKFAFLNYNPQQEFVWCPKKKQREWMKEKQADDVMIH